MENNNDYNNDYSNNGNNMSNVDIYNSPIIKKFNWSAFSDPIFWGIGNKSYLTLLTLIPIFQIVWIFVCGFKGNQWAWENGNYSSLEEFAKVQETWNRAGIARFILNVIAVIGLILLYVLIIAAAVAVMDTGEFQQYYY